MGTAAVPPRLPRLGDHDKPTKTFNRSDPTEYTNDSKVEKDTTTVTVTD